MLSLPDTDKAAETWRRVLVIEQDPNPGVRSFLLSHVGEEVTEYLGRGHRERRCHQCHPFIDSKPSLLL